jgi:hypothetical protein
VQFCSSRKEIRTIVAITGALVSLIADAKVFQDNQRKAQNSNGCSSSTGATRVQKREV